MASAIRGLSGAASGAAAGAAFGPWGAGIGGAAGGLLGLFGGGSEDDQAQQQLEQQQKMYKDLLANYKGPESDPRYQEMMSGLAESSKGGLTPADRAAMLESYSQANQMAHGREGAIQQDAQMRGGGVASSGQNAVLQAQAAQQGAQRAQMQGTQQAGIGSERGLQARQAYLETLQHNANSMNNYRLQAAGGLSGSYNNMANFHGAKGAADNEAIGNLTNIAGNVGSYLNRPQPQAGGQPTAQASPQVPNLNLNLPNSGYQQPEQQKLPNYGGNR